MALDCGCAAVFLEADPPFVNGVCGKILVSPPNGGGRTASYYGVLGFRTRSPMARPRRSASLNRRNGIKIPRFRSATLCQAAGTASATCTARETERCQVRRRRDVNPPRRELLECQPGRKRHCGPGDGCRHFFASECSWVRCLYQCDVLSESSQIRRTLGVYPVYGLPDGGCLMFGTGFLVTGGCVGSGVPVSWAKPWLGYLARLTQVKSVRAPSDGTVA